MGLAEGLTRSERSKLYGTEEIPEAETFLEVTQRAQNALTTIAHTHLGKKIAIITHGMLIFRVLEDLTQTFLETIPNCSFISISYQKKAEQPFTFLDAFHGPK